MAVTNHERVGKALELLKDGLVPFVERELKVQYAQLWFDQARASVSESQADLFGAKDKPRWDAAALLVVMWNQWNEVFEAYARPSRAHARERASRDAQQMGTPADLLH